MNDRVRQLTKREIGELEVAVCTANEIKFRLEKMMNTSFVDMGDARELQNKSKNIEAIIYNIYHGVYNEAARS